MDNFRSTLWDIFNCGVHNNAPQANKLIENLLGLIPQNQSYKFDPKVVKESGQFVSLIKMIREATGLDLFGAKAVAESGEIPLKYATTALIAFMRKNGWIS